jgi:hypothetical protein
MDAPVVAAIVAGSVATVATIVTAGLSWSTLKETKANNARTVAEAKRSKEKDRILASLNEFYGPMQAYLQVSNGLYSILRRGKPAGFRTLTYLLDLKQEYLVDGVKTRVDLTPSERVILREIVGIGEKIQDLILTKGGLVDDKSLMFNYEPDKSVTDIKLDLPDIGLLALTIAHFRVISLAVEGKLSGDAAPFEAFVFPRELPPRITAQIQNLQNRLRSLD